MSLSYQTKTNAGGGRKGKEKTSLHTTKHLHLISLLILLTTLLQTVLGNIKPLTLTGGCENCAKCGSDGIKKFCLECYKSAMTFTSYTDRVCSGSSLPHCLRQVAWEGSQQCLECEDGYGLWVLDRTDTTQGDGSCLKLTDANAVLGTVTGIAKAENIVACKGGYKPNGATCAVLDTSNAMTKDLQVAVTNCVAYDRDYCVMCAPGFVLLKLEFYDFSPIERKAPWMVSCLQKGDAVMGCRGVGVFEQCVDCDVRNEYKATDVKYYGFGQQFQVCANTAGVTTSLGTLEELAKTTTQVSG